MGKHRPRPGQRSTFLFPLAAPSGTKRDLVTCKLPSFNVHTLYIPYIHSCAFATAQAHSDQWLQRSTGRWAKDPHELYKLVHSRPSSIFWVARHLKLIYKGETLRTSLVVQWLRIQLAMQGMRVRFLIRELRSHMTWSNKAHTPQLLSPWATVREAVCCNGKSHMMQQRSCVHQLRLKAAN